MSFLRRELMLSYGLLKRLKYQDAYRVNDISVRVNHAVRTGDIITVNIEETQPEIGAENDPLTILYEDEAMIALDKPAGMIMHPTYHRITGTLVNRLLGYYERTGQKSAVHLVNRLDRDTFGVVLVAKNAHIHALLCEQMQSGQVRKTYHAAVYGHPADQQGVMDHPIARCSPTSLLRCVRADGKPAQSTYRAIRTADRCTLLELEPITGRTHQLRVHCAYEGFPILGDVQYGTETSQVFSQLLGFTHQQLCAMSLALRHPLSDQAVSIQSQYSVQLYAGGDDDAQNR